MIDNKKNIISGVLSLLISAILQAYFSCYLQNNWIIFIFTCIYAVFFLKYLKDERVVNWLIGRLSRKTLKAIGIIVLFIGISFLPQSFAQQLEAIVKFTAYIASYICWMIGLLLIDISSVQ